MWRAQFLKRIFLIIDISSIFISCGINLEAIQKRRTNSKLYGAKAALALHVQESYYAFSTTATAATYFSLLLDMLVVQPTTHNPFSSCCQNMGQNLRVAPL
jgi:hypothetical protein